MSYSPQKMELYVYETFTLLSEKIQYIDISLESTTSAHVCGRIPLI